MWPAGGTLSATRASSRASSRSGATSGTLEDGPTGASGSRRTSRRGVPVSASRAGAARAAAILLISRHVKAVRRDGGAHPPKCAAKGELDNVCSARSIMHVSVFERRRPPRGVLECPTFHLLELLSQLAMLSFRTNALIRPMCQSSMGSHVPIPTSYRILHDSLFHQKSVTIPNGPVERVQRHSRSVCVGTHDTTAAARVR